jgi:SAM-dependent MidA family methyltransferase
MDLALHHPTWGYYARGPERLGPRGDFVTASDAGSAFGEAVAQQLLELDARLRAPDPFHVVEVGCGRGLLARDLLDGLERTSPDLRRRVRCHLADTSPGMREAAAARVPEAEVRPPGALPEGLTGCLLAVELFDALPVHRLRRRRGQRVEVGVGLSQAGDLVEVEREPDPRAAALADRYGAAAEEGDEAEVCPALEEAVAALARTLARGFLLVVDYGHEARELYGPRHAAGTLLAYHRHRVHEAVLARPGEQDLTAHVNFTHLADAATAAGFRLVGGTTQDRFLVANGILRWFTDAAPDTWGRPEEVLRRRQALQLLHPDGMGRRFKVLVLAKGDVGEGALQGLADPFAR